VGFEFKISSGERPQTYALDRAATWTGCDIPRLQNMELETGCKRKFSTTNCI